MGAQVTYLSSARPAVRSLPAIKAGSAWTAVLISASFGLYLTASWTLGNLAVADGRVMARTVQAWMVFFGAIPGIRQVTAGGAPLPLLLQLPFALLPTVTWPGVGAAIVGCAMAALLLAAVAVGLAALGIGPRARLLLLALCAVQPMLVFGAALGSGGVTTAATTAWAFVLAIRWAVTGRSLNLILSAFVLGVACLASYWSILAAFAIVGVVLATGKGDRDRAYAQATAYVVPIVGVVLPWLLIVALVGRAADAQNLPEQLTSPDSPLPVGLVVLYLAAVSSCFCLWRALREGLRTRRPLELLLSGMAATLLVPGIASWQTGGHIRAAELLPVLPAGVLLTAWWIKRHPPRIRPLALAAAAGMLIASMAVQLWAWNAGSGSRTEQRLAQMVETGRLKAADPIERKIGMYLAQRQAGRGVLLDKRLGYRAMYWDGGAGSFYTSADAASLPGLIAQPQRYLRYVLVSHLGQEPNADAVDRTFGGLYRNGSSWATLEQEWPVGASPGNGWRLYRVLSSEPAHG